MPSSRTRLPLALVTLGAAVALTSCAAGGGQAAAVAEALRGASSEVDAVVARTASDGFALRDVYDVYVPGLDDENFVPIVSELLEAVAPAYESDDPLQLILYATSYSEDPLVKFAPFSSDPETIDALGLDADGDGDSSSGEGFIVAYPDDLARAFG